VPRALRRHSRLGAIDPNAEPYKGRLAAEHVNVFDLTDIKSSDAVNHNKFVQSPELIRLVGNRLASGQTERPPPKRRRPIFGGGRE